MRRGHRLEFKATKRAPAAPEKADNHRTAIEGFGKADEIAGVAWEPEERRPFTGLYRLRRQAGLHQLRNGALQRRDDAWRSAGRESASARIKLRLQGHVAPFEPRREISKGRVFVARPAALPW